MSEELIYDIETLGQDARNAPILSMAYLTFDSDRFVSNPYTFQELVEECTYVKFNVKDQVEGVLQRRPEPETLEWWKTVPEEVRKRELTPSDKDVNISEFVTNLSGHNAEKVWTRGNGFDPVFLDYVTRDLNMEAPYPWWLIRDTRSYLEGLLIGTELKNNYIPKGIEGFEAHDPKHDISMDVMRMQTAVGVLFSE
jgi:hypothetical protein